jgi:glutathione S-transferase
MLEIWGRLSSINVRKVVWAAQEAGVAFQRIDAGGAFGLVQSRQYVQMNPNALVPVLKDGKFLLWESNVIVRYLCAKYAASLYPEDLEQRFDAERWMDWQQTRFNPAGREAFVQLIRTPLAERNPEAIASSVAATEPLLELLDRHLSQSEHVAGERFTMADIPLACEIHRWWGLPRPRPPVPHVERWYERMLARPAARGVLDLELS